MVGVDVAWTPLPEVVASAGADAAFVDMEHTTLSLSEVENLIVACDKGGISAPARCPGPEHHGGVQSAGFRRARNHLPRYPYP